LNLRKKTILFIGLTTVILLLIVAGLSRKMTLGNALDAEDRHTRTSVQRVLGSMEDEFSSMNAIVSNFSAWDDTVHFLQSPPSDPRNQAYLASNYDNAMFLFNRFDAVVIFDRLGKVRYQKYYDAVTDRVAPVPSAFYKALHTNDDELLFHANTMSYYSGILMAGDRPMLVVSRPVVNSGSQGQIYGTFLVARALNNYELDVLSRKSQLKVSLTPYRQAQLPEGLILPKDGKVQSGTLWVERPSPDAIQGYALLSDIFWQPQVVLGIEEPRETYSMARNTYTGFLIGLAIVCFLFAVGIVFLLERMILSRLSLLHGGVEQISASSDFSTRVKVTGRDEISGLEAEFNEMMGVLERSQNQIRDQAHHDPLTGLPNRILFFDRVQKALQEAERTASRVAFLFLDIDKFKPVNDTFGHRAGDELLIEVAARLKKCLGEGATIARIGGDEFTIILPDMAEVEAVERLAQDVRQVLATPFQYGGHSIRITASIGISLYPEDGRDPETLVKNADMAMFRVKEVGKDNVLHFNTQLQARYTRKLQVEHHLRQAIENEELYLHYQPKLDLRTGKIVGMEALLRWESPELGRVTPDEFIPVAEASGCIVEIGDWVLRTACRENKSWQDRGLQPLSVAVNLSLVQLEQSDFVERVARLLEEIGYDPKLLELEVTESLAMQQVDRVISQLEGLKGLGVSVAIDDFGTGYSSLSQLSRFPVDSLKIDRSFMREISESDDERTIAKTIIGLAHSLNLRVIAEGVETEEQLEFLRRQDCDEIQGFWLSRPVGAREFEERFLQES
jgi:diguanylate cyclase (GGDEF)-like protein